MTKLRTLIAPTALLAAFTLAAAPSFAQEKDHGRERPQQSSGQSHERAQPRAASPRPQAGAAPRVETRQQAPRAQQAQPPQSQPQARRQPRQAPQPRQAEQQRQAQPRAENRSNENRSNDARRYESQRAVPRGNVYAPHYEPRYSPRAYASRSFVRPYVFRPRFSIGFGIYAGYPVPYTYSYSYPIMVYGYRAPREAVMVAPGSPYYGGVALEMTPADADVYVDGTYAGRVEDFDGTTQPLTLTAGMHEIAVQAPGFEPMRVNVEVQPGQVIPYRGDLQPN